MGCFDKTCVLTNTSISVGEPCVVIVLNDIKVNTFYNLLGDVHSQAERESNKLEEYEKEMLKKTPFNSIGHFFPIRYVVMGTYNEYGSIEEKDRLPNEDEKIFPDESDDMDLNSHFFHKWAVEYVLDDDVENWLDTPVKLAEKLYEYMYLLRKTPLTLEFSGKQHKDGEEMDEMIKFNYEIIKYLVDNREEYRLEEEDKKNWDNKFKEITRKTGI